MDDEPAAADGDGGLKVIGNASEIIETVESHGSARVTEVAGALEMPTSTVHAYLKSLVSAGYLVREDEEYALGLRFLEHGGQVRNDMHVYKVAKPEIDELAEQTGELSNLGVEENGKRVLLYKAEGEEAVYDDAPTGEFTHMHWSALGKAILSELSDDRVEAIAERHGLPEGTGSTITDLDALHEELDRTRARGYSLENENRVSGIQAVAMPVCHQGSVIGAVAISGPNSRITRERIESELADALQNTVNVIELKYSHY